MSNERRSPVAARSGAQLAKAALLRLAQAQLEPTPENYARAYAIEAGVEATPAALPERAALLLAKLLTLGVPVGAARQQLQQSVREARWDEALQQAEQLLQSQQSPAAQAQTLAVVIERLVRGLERGGRHWTVARKKDGLQRALDGKRTDLPSLVLRLQQLVISWNNDTADASIDLDEAAPGDTLAGALSGAPSGDAGLPSVDEAATLLPAYWPAIETSLHDTVRHALQNPLGHGDELIAELDAAQAALLRHGATPERVQQTEALCQRARHMLDHRLHLFGQLGQLCRELSASLVELAEDDSWTRGQAAAMNDTLNEGLSGRGVRSVSEMLLGTRTRQRALRDERGRARDALKSLIQQMLVELAELGQHTDRFQDNVGRYAQAIEQADSLESLAGTVREMVEESRSVQALVRQTQERLSLEHERASALSRKVNELEDELRRVSSEVQTDQLTQIANRRGLIAAFATEQAKAERQTSDAAPIALALLDIDNFKKLNDSLGHAAGDMALKSLAERVSQMLRPGDMVARYGGEEFVLMLPATPLDEAQQVLARLQRALSASLFMHEGKDVFVTFSAGVTAYRSGETLEAALDRADVALYEAKHTGKNRACVAP
jgi:diguanylate cyclase